MKTWKKIRDKFSYFLNSVPEGLAPVVGSLLILLITFALVGVVVSSVDFSKVKNLQPPMARITLESCEGGLYGVGPLANRARFEENMIVLIHEGGDPLPLDSISIKIFGYGNSFQGSISEGTGKRIEGSIQVLYMDLTKNGKNTKYYVVNNKATIEDGLWDVGERLVLCGRDSAVGTVESSVKVSVNGDDNTSDNYGFKAGSEINLKVVDRKGRNVIAERTAIVKIAE
ncbi:MAG: type IV pilin N-terminal domain-containing protein [Euryarchaeota archaeon]|nr:type IV pilin N-terminal domain-containing protein [Euryarchaeota archaeon]